MHPYFIRPNIAELQWQVAVEVKISQLLILTVDSNVHAGAFLTGFYCHFDHLQQYKTISQKQSTHFDL